MLLDLRLGWELRSRMTNDTRIGIWLFTGFRRRRILECRLCFPSLSLTRTADLQIEVVLAFGRFLPLGDQAVPPTELGTLHGKMKATAIHRLVGDSGCSPHLSDCTTVYSGTNHQRSAHPKGHVVG
jgi:hypothetical protein